MSAYVNEIVSTVRTVDGDTLLSPPTLARIVQAVLKAQEDHDRHQQRIYDERRITPKPGEVA